MSPALGLIHNWQKKNLFDVDFYLICCAMNSNVFYYYV